MQPDPALIAKQNIVKGKVYRAFAEGVSAPYLAEALPLEWRATALHCFNATAHEPVTSMWRQRRTRVARDLEWIAAEIRRTLQEVFQPPQSDKQ